MKMLNSAESDQKDLDSSSSPSHVETIELLKSQNSKPHPAPTMSKREIMEELSRQRFPWEE
jgi:hypothetical protein